MRSVKSQQKRKSSKSMSTEERSQEAKLRAARKAAADLQRDPALREATRVLGRLGGLIGGRSTSPKKQAAARRNGLLGWPLPKKPKPTTSKAMKKSKPKLVEAR